MTKAAKKSSMSRLLWRVEASPAAGVDEVGRGPLAGAVLAAAVILDPKRRIAGLADSKMLTEEQREDLFPLIQQRALAFAIGRAEVAEIEALNIFHASLLAMQRAVMALPISPALVLVDGSHCPVTPYAARAIIKGDQKIAAISAASILAKVTRDREMRELSLRYPGYGFERHKGYATREHLEALQRLGPCEIHRRNFGALKSAGAAQLELEMFGT